MKNHDVHGLVQSQPPQTHCGLNPFGRKATTDPFKVTCAGCKSVMSVTGDMPNLEVEIKKRGRGRPREGTNNV